MCASELRDQSRQELYAYCTRNSHIVVTQVRPVKHLTSCLLYSPKLLALEQRLKQQSTACKHAGIVAGEGRHVQTCCLLVFLLPGLGLIQESKESSFSISRLLLLPLFAASLLLSHIPAEVVKDLAPLLGLVNGFVARVPHQPGQLALPPGEGSHLDSSSKQVTGAQLVHGAEHIDMPGLCHIMWM